MRYHPWIALVCLVACGGRQAVSESSSGDPPTTVGGMGGATGSGGSGISVGSGGMPSKGMAHVCSFGPEPVNPFTGGASRSEIQVRIEHFLLGKAEPPQPLSGITPADAAMKILDRFGGASSESPGGFIRWLAKWSYTGEVPRSAARWANVMAAPMATLGSLIAAPNPDNGLKTGGYMVDKELLTGQSSIDRRGRMVMGLLLCQAVPAAPPNVMLPMTVPTPGISERDAHAQQIMNPPCHACHGLLDPAGHAFGHFDRMGNYMDVENGVPIDASDRFSFGGDDLPFSSLDDLAPQLAKSCEVARCIARSFLRAALDPEDILSAELVTDEEVIPVANAFADSGFEFRSLVRAIVEQPVFLR